MKTIYLKYPVVLGERTVSELTLSWPKVKHFMRTDGHATTDVASDVALLSGLTGEPESLLQEIDPRDWAKIRYDLQKIYAVFFGLKADYEDSSDEATAVENPTQAADLPPQK